jgi:thiamine pyrophosphokinase
MSSHHIVREKQEPALIIANGEACTMDLLEQLLEWSPLVVVLDGAVERVMSLGIKIDVLFGDFDGLDISLEEIEKNQFPIEIIHAPDQEKTDLEKALDYLISRGFPAVNIIWATGRRSDHTIANVTNLVKYRELIQVKMIDNHSVIYPLSPFPAVFSKWYKAGTLISLIPIGVAEGIETENLVYPLKKESLTLGQRIGNSNAVEKDGLISIKYTKGEMLIMECSD